jgi:3-mercaptopyruvate sulfurtransferase SseA
MIKKLIFRDVVGGWILLTACVLGGVIVNETRPDPLPLVYSSPEVRLDRTVEKMDRAPIASIPVEGDVDLDEMRKISSTHQALILDARPDVFYRLGHIPSALSLPRDDFENRYHALASVLQSHRNDVLVVYCSGRDCQDSQMLGDALGHLGYPHVRLFRGGWSDWESGNLPEEKE